MSRRIEIQPEPRGMARIETFVGSQLTGISEVMPLVAARLRAETMGDIVVDHTILGRSAV
jgi:hypothetical protein